MNKLVEASESLLKQYKAYQASNLSMEEAYYKLAKYAYNNWKSLEQALSEHRAEPGADVRGLSAVCSILEQYELSYGDTVNLREAKVFIAAMQTNKED